VSDLSALVIREGALQDEAELLRMMRVLAEQELGKIKFDEPAARASFRRLLSLPAFGRAWLLFEESKPVGYIVLTIGSALSFTAMTLSSTSCTSTPLTDAVVLAGRLLPSWSRKHARWA